MKPGIFIGSSSEGKAVAEAIQFQLRDDATVRVWDQNVFALGETTLETLLRQLVLADYAILILTPDDRTTSRRVQARTPRDNVLFELGLFMGCLGRRRAFFVVCEVGGERPKLASDLLGANAVTVRWDGRRGTLDAAVAPACHQLRQAFLQRSQQAELRMLPATALAVGYFRNFVLEVCRALMDQRRFLVNGKARDLSKDIFDFHVVLPDSLEQASHVGLRDLKLRGRFEDCVIRKGSREFPFFVKTVVRRGRVAFYDMPTTLKASGAAVELIAAGDTLGTSDERALLGARELYNFRLTLEHLLATDGDAVDFRDNVHLTTLHEVLASSAGGAPPAGTARTRTARPRRTRR